MKPSDKTMVRFYQQLGKIFYAIAEVDQTVSKNEIEELKTIVRKEWLPFEKTFDEFGSDSAFQIEIVFDWLIENEWDIESAIPNFKLFKSEHEHLFNQKVNDLILKTAEAIAKSFSGKNKSEHIIISQIKLILENQN